MALTYSWVIRSLKTKNETNSDGVVHTAAVVQTYWECKGTDENGNSGTFNGATPFTARDVPAGSFKAFADLTEADVLGWIQGRVNGDASYKAHIDEQIQKQIDEIVSPVTEVDRSNMPWATPDDEVTPTPADPEADPE
jgi:hypothetical protein